MRRERVAGAEEACRIKEFLPSDKISEVFCHNKQAEKGKEVDV